MAPGDPIKTDLQQAIFTAGEIAALLLGQRGLVLVQMFNGWDPSKGQPLYNPFTLHTLERALSAPGVGFRSSVAPGGVGLTAVLYADREPYASWAEHLCSFGCQANIVAGSAYYKLLIGQLLGYKLENVLGYMAASGEPASAQLQQQVGGEGGRAVRGASRGRGNCVAKGRTMQAVRQHTHLECRQAGGQAGGHAGRQAWRAGHPAGRQASSGRRSKQHRST